MLSEENRKKVIAGGTTVIFLVMTVFYFLNGIRAVSRAGSVTPAVFAVDRGEGFFRIVRRLDEAGLIKSPLVFTVSSFLTGSAGRLKPGIYNLSSSFNSVRILGMLVRGPEREVVVTIPEGSSFYDVDDVLSRAGVLRPSSFVDYLLQQSESFEGRLFPDTYRFFSGTPPAAVLEKFLGNFTEKAEPFLGREKNRLNADLTLASLLEKEVPEFHDRRLVAGVLKRRLAAGMLLQVDATICYIKRSTLGEKGRNCYPLDPLDFKIDSPYNTYLYKGLPPGPIGNPGTSSIIAALDPEESPYWFYLSDPETGKTIFSKTFDEHEDNRVKYLRR
ncbi:endolytic transglycosylase MltG [Candidatus Parcubacteria bacterium]|nr:MAG: endolytic transglycosylase MltG [Candidatus Parcubacteria bacterium]